MLFLALLCGSVSLMILFDGVSKTPAPVVPAPTTTRTTVGKAERRETEPAPTTMDVRAAAEASDRKLLAMVRQKQTAVKRKPDAAVAHASWRRQIRELQEQIADVREFPPGSIAWHQRRALRAMLADAPPSAEEPAEIADPLFPHAP